MPRDIHSGCNHARLHLPLYSFLGDLWLLWHSPKYNGEICYKDMSRKWHMPPLREGASVSQPWGMKISLALAVASPANCSSGAFLVLTSAITNAHTELYIYIYRRR